MPDREEPKEVTIPAGSVSGDDLQRLVLVGDDLEYLMALPGDRLLSHAEVRACANVLRRLLIDQQLAQVMKSLLPPKGFPLAVEIVDLDSALRRVPPQWVKFAWAGGRPTGGAHHRGFILYRIPKGEWERYGSLEKFYEAADLPKVGDMTTQFMNIPSLLRSTSVAIGADAGLVQISRQEVLQYVANKAGGVHFDPTRKVDPDALGKRIKKRKHEREVKAKLLDYAFIWVGHLSGPEYEIASLAHGVASAPWASEIARGAREAAPEDFNGDPNNLKFWDGSQWNTSTFRSEENDAT